MPLQLCFILLTFWFLILGNSYNQLDRNTFHMNTNEEVIVSFFHSPNFQFDNILAKFWYEDN